MSTLSAAAQPLPEPGLVLYGTVTTAGSNEARRLVQGTLEWTIQPGEDGPPVRLRAQLTNLNDQFSYVLEIPFETRVIGPESLGATPGVLELKPAGDSFDRTTALLDGQPLSLSNPGQGTFRFGPADRGRFERVDLILSATIADSDRDGLDDAWERTFFGGLDRDGSGDFDRDGLTDSEEYRSGTNPKDSQSQFRLVEVIPSVEGPVQVRWSSVAGRRYTVERSSDLRGGFSPIQSDVSATPPENRWTDLQVAPGMERFYRIRVDP